MENGPKTQGSRLVVVLWVVLGSVFFYFSYAYIHTSMNDGKLTDYMVHAVQISGAQSRPPKELRDLILVNAEELGLPIRGEQIIITGIGASLNVALSYEVDFTAPFSSHVLYRKTFSHNVGFNHF